MKKKYLLFFGILIVILFLIFINSKIEQNKQPCLSLTFDDGSITHYTIVYPMLRERNLSASFFIIANLSGRFDNKILMNKSQIKELSENGFEIGSHTLSHPFLIELNKEEIKNELEDSKKILEDNYNITINSLAIPFGDYNKDILKIAKKYYGIVRDEYPLNSDGFYSVKSISINKNTNPEKICKEIKYFKENKGWLILIFHDVTDFPNNWDITIENFTKILDCVKDSEINTDSLKGCKIKYKQNF